MPPTSCKDTGNRTHVMSISITNCTVLMMVTVQIPPMILNNVTIAPEMMMAASSESGVTTVMNTPMAYSRTMLSNSRTNSPTHVMTSRTENYSVVPSIL